MSTYSPRRYGVGSNPVPVTTRGRNSRNMCLTACQKIYQIYTSYAQNENNIQ